jgi:hypothetical protein
MSSADGGDWVHEHTRHSLEDCERAQRDGVAIEGTAAELYLLKQRKLQQPFWDGLRYLPDARTGEGALIAPLSVLDNGKAAGYLATFLDPDGRKSAIDPVRQTWKLDEKPTPNAIFDLPTSETADITMICDGLEDAMSVWLATFGKPRRVIGLPGIWALRHLVFPEHTKLLVIPDGDAPGSQGAKWLSEGIDRQLLSGCVVYCTPIPAPQTPKIDANQIYADKGIQGLRDWIAQAAPASLSDDGEIRRLAGLKLLDYARERAAAAKQLGIALKFLDQAVENMRKQIAEEAEAVKDDFIDIDETRPWGDEVDGADLLDELVTTLGRYVVMTPAQRNCVALWIVFTHCFEAAVTAAKLWVKSAERRSGKTRLLELLSRLCSRAIKADAISPAMIPRVIEAMHPTLLLDEFDTLIKDNDALRGVINSGFDRGSVIIIGVRIGDDWVPREFSPWCPQALAGIGSVPDTIADRSFKIELERKPRAVKVARLRRRDAGSLDDLARKCVRWAKDNAAWLVDAEPKVPNGLNDRAADAWVTCIAIADLAGGNWGKHARSAAVSISGDSAVADDESIRITLLSDIRDVFAEQPVRRHAQSDKDIGKQIGSLDLVEKLNEMEHRPWPEIRRGQPMTQPTLARLLKPFHITPGNLKEGSGSAELVYRGYKETQFKVAWERYLPPPPQPHPTSAYSDPPVETADSSATPLRPEGSCGLEPDFEGATSAGSSAPENPENPNVSAGGSGVAAEMADYESVSEYAQVSSISAISGQQGVTQPNGSDPPAAPPNDATDGYIFASVEEGARHYMASNPGWSLARIAKELAVPLSRIEDLFPERSALVTKVRAALAEDPSLTAWHIAKRVKRPRSAVERALRVLGQ